MPFAKLDSGIINSSIWAEPLATRVLWITILAMKDENGFVGAAKSGLQRAANISSNEFDIAIKSLESPDIDSRTTEYEGRRIEKIEGGWIVLNHEKYRLHDDIQREKTRERVRKHRIKCNNVTKCNVTDTLPSVSVSESVSGISEGGVGETKKGFIKPTVEEISAYCKERKNSIDAHEFYDHYEARGWKPKGYTQKMTDWKAAVRTWEKYDKEKKGQQPVSFKNKAEPGKYDKIDREGKM